MRCVVEAVIASAERLPADCADLLARPYAALRENVVQGRGAVARLRRAIRDGQPFTTELLNYRKDGTPFWNELSVSPVRDEEGRLTHFVGVQTDVTERRRLEEQYRQAQKMDAVGQLAGGIAHDFNNLLTPMLMAVKLLREDRPADERAGLLATLQAGAERGAELVRKLLSFAGGGGGERCPVAVGDIVREIEGIAAHTFPKSIRVDIRLPADLPPVLADATQFSQVVLNLCVNARDAMPNGGRLELAASNVEIDAPYAAMNQGVAPGRYVVIQVTDTGTGIPREIIDRIFEPFFTTKEGGRGNGLGLMVASSIVREHAGQIQVESEVGRGTTFFIDLPYQALESSRTDDREE